jgi:hypothetical protein
MATRILGRDKGAELGDVPVQRREPQPVNAPIVLYGRS